MMKLISAIGNAVIKTMHNASHDQRGRQIYVLLEDNIYPSLMAEDVFSLISDGKITIAGAIVIPTPHVKGWKVVL